MATTITENSQSFQPNRCRMYWLDTQDLFWVLRLRSDPRLLSDLSCKSFLDIPEIPVGARIDRIVVEHDPMQIGIVVSHHCFDDVPYGQKMPQFPNKYSKAWTLTREQIERTTKININFKEFV